MHVPEMPNPYTAIKGQKYALLMNAGLVKREPVDDLGNIRRP